MLEFNQINEEELVFEDIELLLNNEELDALRQVENQIQEELDKVNGDWTKLDESLFSTILGGAAGLVIGPAIGKVIAKALGIEKGILYDMFKSKLVGAALGAAIAKHLGSKKKK